MKHQSYLTRALKANDRRYARVFDRLGYNTINLPAEEVEEIDVDKLRETYKEVFGKQPYMGWDAKVLLAKIEEKRANG